MNLEPIASLIEVKGRPETTLELGQAMAKPEGTLRSYVYTDTIRAHIHRILDSVSDERGQGFWVQAEYGGGKTHFLAAIGSLLSGDEAIWDCVTDGEIRSRYPNISQKRLLPVVFSLRGQSSTDVSVSRSLYKVLEEQVQSAAERRLGRRLSFSTADEIESWWETLRPGVRSDFDDAFREQTGVTADEYRTAEGSEAFSRVVLDIATRLRIEIPLQVSTRDRILNAYNQITAPDTEYRGLLVIIDEFAYWQERHPEGTKEYAEDEELLETLAWSLPQGEGAEIYTIVASQKPVLSKFRAGQQEGRFITLEVLRGARGEEVLRDYELIVSHRVRSLRQERLPEIDEYLHHYREVYPFARQASEEQFRVAFPVQDQCFEILRRLTQRLEATRVGINVLWELLADQASFREGDETAKPSERLTGMRRLITAADLLDSPSLQAALSEVQFRHAFTSYENAIETIDKLRDLEDDERDLATKIVATLFLWYLANLDQPVPLTAEELAQAVLAEAGIFSEPKQAVIAVLEPLRGAWISWDAGKETVQFEPRAIAGRPPQEILDEFRARRLDPSELEQRWQDELINPALAVDNLTALFAGRQPMVQAGADVGHRQVLYSGQEVVTASWEARLGAELQDPTTHFRVVYLLKNVTLSGDALDDDRIAVVILGQRSEAADAALRDYIAFTRMESEYQVRQDPEAIQVKDYANSRRADFIRDLLQQQRRTYEQGEIVTRSSLQIDPKEIFQLPQAQQRTEAVVDQVLSHAYRDRPIGTIRKNLVFSPQNAGQVFEGFFKPHPQRRAHDAALNFGPGLGLSTPENPRVFNPDHCRVFDEFIRERYAAARERGEALPTWELYQELARRGIPVHTTTLYLLCFVRRAQERADLVLRPGHRIRFDNGTAPADRITAAQVPQVEWKHTWATGEAFESLAEAGLIPWSDVLDWTRKINDKLKAVVQPEEVEAQEKLLFQDLYDLAEDAKNDLARLEDDLQKPLGQPLPQDVKDTLELAASYKEIDGYAALCQLATEKFETADEFGEHIAKARRLHELAQGAGTIGRAYTYLTAVPSQALPSELAVEREALLARFSVEAFITDPSAWKSLEHEFGQWRRRYRTAYQKFHRDYVNQAAGIEGQRDEIEAELQALANLDAVSQLGDSGQADTLRGRWNAVSGAVRSCTVREPDAIDVENIPRCSVCNLEYGTLSPATDVEELRKDLRNAVDRKLGALQAAAIRELLEKSDDDMAAQFAKAVAISDRARIIELMNVDGSTELLRRLLRKVSVVDGGITAAIRQEFPTVDRETAPKAAKRFGELLDETLSKAEKKGKPGTHIEVRL